MDKVVCIRDFFDKIDRKTLFIEGREYFLIKEEGSVCSFLDTVYVYHSKISNACSGYRFHTNKNKTHDVLEYLYDYFENPRLAKLKKIKLIYENI